MRNVFKLFSYDIKHLFGNVITVIIVLGLVFLPSIFTWYNVIACWNVFDNTGNLKVAVANSDEGYQSDLLPTKINVGDSVESALRANDQLDWVFTDEEDAIDGARSGKYYAAVVIPQSFSSDMMSFYSDNAEHAELIYYENEKKNAVAPRVTDQASSKVAAQVNTTFAETISDVALGLIDSLGTVADDADAAGQVAKLSGTISSSADQMRTAADVLESYANLAGTAQALVGSSTQLLGNAQNAVKDAQQQASGAKSGAETIGDALTTSVSSLSDALAQSSDGFNQVPAAIEKVYAQVDTDKASAAQSLRDQAADVDSQIERYQQLIEVLESIKPQLDEQYRPAVDAVVSQLRRIGGFDAERAERIVGACVPSKRQMEYRNKLEFSCAFDAKQGFQMGFHQKGSDKILAADACPLAHKQAQKTPKALRGALRYLTGREDLGIHRVGVRHSHRSGDLEVALWTTPGPFPRNAVAKTLSTAVKASSIVRVMTADAGSARKRLEILDGRGFWRETVAGIEHGVSAPSFFQVNTPQADKLVQLALDGLELDEDCVAADLFCGVGTFTIPLAKRCGGVYAVESYGSSVRNLRHTVEQENVDVEVIGGDATRELPELGELDALIVDPPRSGLAKEIIGSIAEAAPLRVAYVSCDPATWARDVKLLEAAGFELLQATPVDMFPQTFHVETVSIFANKNQ